MTHCENTRESRLNIPSSTSLLPKSVTFRTLEACCYRNVFDVNAKISLLQTPVSRIMKWEGTQRVAKHVCVSLTPPSRVFRPWINPGTRPEVAVPHLFAFRGLSFLCATGRASGAIIVVQRHTNRTEKVRDVFMGSGWSRRERSRGAPVVGTPPRGRYSARTRDFPDGEKQICVAEAHFPALRHAPDEASPRGFATAFRRI